MAHRYNKLIFNLKNIFIKHGVREDVSQSLSSSLVEAEVTGKVSHGFRLVPLYIQAFKHKLINTNSQVDVVSEKHSNVIMDANYLPGAYAMSKAIDTAIEKCQKFGSSTTCVKKCSHTGSLSSLFSQIASSKFCAIIFCSVSDTISVAPYGSTKAVIGTNPIGMIWPNENGYDCFDLSISSATINHINMCKETGIMLEKDVIVSPTGDLSRNPTDFENGYVLPLGGQDLGYKGFCLGLIAPILASGLSGFGQLDYSNNPNKGLGRCEALIQMYDPNVFSGMESFLQQSKYLKSTSIEGKNRWPGSRSKLIISNLEEDSKALSIAEQKLESLQI